MILHVSVWFPTAAFKRGGVVFNYLYLGFDAGGDLLSHTLPGAVPSALTGLASGFGKGPGVTPSL